MPVQLITPRRFGDARGWFVETYNLRSFADRGITDIFVQDNHSLSGPVGTLRGLHFQTPPAAQAKLVRCIAGAIWDVAIDLRAGSPTFAKWVASELSAENGHQLYIPPGFAHGFVTLRPDTEVAYKVSAFYAPEADAGLAWDDPDLALPWPLDGRAPELSDKDRAQPRLKDWRSPFVYDGRPLEPLGGEA